MTDSMIDPNKCPFCQQSNRCNAQSNSCWCQSKGVPEALIALVPPESKQCACICEACITLFTADNALFKKQFNV